MPPIPPGLGKEVFEVLNIPRSMGRSSFLAVIAIGLLALFALVAWVQLDTGTDTSRATGTGAIARECSWFVLPDPVVAVNQGDPVDYLTEEQKAGARGADAASEDGQSAVRAEPSAAELRGLRPADAAQAGSGALDRRPVLSDSEAARLAGLPVADQDALFQDCLESGAFDAIPMSQMTRVSEEREVLLADRWARLATPRNNDAPMETVPPPIADGNSPPSTR